MRKTVEYVVSDNNRDLGKKFIITEMSAAQAENWAMRALLALIGNGVDMPQGFESAGMAGMAEMGIRALSSLKWDVAEPLLNEMLECIKVMPDPSRPMVTRALIEDDTEEVTTRIKLRMEVWKLHTDFLRGGVLSTLAAQQQQDAGENTPKPPTPRKHFQQ